MILTLIISVISAALRDSSTHPSIVLLCQPITLWSSSSFESLLPLKWRYGYFLDRLMILTVLLELSKFLFRIHPHFYVLRVDLTNFRDRSCWWWLLGVISDRNFLIRWCLSEGGKITVRCETKSNLEVDLIAVLLIRLAWFHRIKFVE